MAILEQKSTEMAETGAKINREQRQFIISISNNIYRPKSI
jgi:hypothetical protein